MFDRESAVLVDPRLQDLFFIMAVSNSCMNPLVYGSYAMDLWGDCRRCCDCLLPTRKLTVASATTRSTGACHNVRRINVNTPEGNMRKHLRIRQRLDCAGKISNITNPDFTACSVSFHSDPNPLVAANRSAENLNITLADQGLLTTRSLDRSMFVGYRRYGHQKRWRPEWALAPLPVDNNSYRFDLNSKSRFSTDYSAVLCSTVKKNDFFNSGNISNENSCRVNFPSIRFDSSDPRKRTTTRVHFADPITEAQPRRCRRMEDSFSLATDRFPHASEHLQDTNKNVKMRHSMYGRNDTPF